MKLSKIELVEYRKPFKVGFHSPQIHRRAAESVLVKFIFSNGATGFGEAAPRDYVTRESCRTVIDVIRHTMAPVLFDADPKSFDDILRILEETENRCLHNNKAPYLAALAAVDLALLDAWGKQTQTPISKILGRYSTHRVDRSISIPFLPADAIQSLFERLQRVISIDSVKVLMKSDLEENIQRVAFIRSLIGSKMPLRIEANGKWSFKEAIRHIEKLTPFKIASIEEPLSSAKPENLRRLRKQIDVNIILDESICTYDDAKKMITANACDGFNLKLSKCGGLLKLLALADFAHQNNINCQLGTHVGESPILDAAGSFAAYSHPAFTIFEGYSSLLFLDLLSKDNKRLQSLTEAPPLQEVGLGSDLQSTVPLFDSSEMIEIVP